MNDIKRILKLIENDKKKTNTYDRYPIRFLFMNLHENIENDISMIHSNLIEKYTNKEKNYNDVKIINIADLLLFNDGWVSKKHLLDYIMSLLETNNDYLIMGFSEFIRFLSKEDLESILISFMTNVESLAGAKKQRFYFICFSLFSQISIELANNSRNESINPIINYDLVNDTESKQICIYYTNSTYNSKYFENKITTSYDWLTLYKIKKINLNHGIVCVSDTLVKLYEQAKPDNFVQIEKVDSYYKILRYMFNYKIIRIKEEDFEGDYWKKLFDYCFELKTFDFLSTCKAYFKTTTIDDDNIINVYSSTDSFGRLLLYMYVIECSDNFKYGNYISNVFKETYLSDINQLYNTIITSFNTNTLEISLLARNFYIKKINAIVNDLTVYSSSLRQSYNHIFESFLIQNVFKVKVDGKDDIFIFDINQLCEKYQMGHELKDLLASFYNMFISKTLSNCLYLEYCLVVNLFKNGVITDFKKIKEEYPELYYYLGSMTNEYITNDMQWITDYLFEYKKSKTSRVASAKYTELIMNNTPENFYKWYNSTGLKHPSELLAVNNYDKLFVLDGVGSEYFDYLLYLARQKNKNVVYASYSKSYCPTITSINKSHLLLKNMEWINEFDNEIIHGTFYNDSELIVKSLEKLKKIVYEIIDKNPMSIIAITADHGSTVCGKLLPTSKKYNFEAEHEGRCAKLESFDGIKDSDDYCKYIDNSTESKWILSLKNQSLSDNPKRESHGGATIEEVIVPCIILSSNLLNINYNIVPLETKLTGLNHSVKFEITPPPAVIPVLEEETGDKHNMIKLQNNIWECDINSIRAQTIIIRVKDKEYYFDVTTSMGYKKIGDDGFDD